MGIDGFAIGRLRSLTDFKPSRRRLDADLQRNIHSLMELPSRPKNDRFLPDGSYRQLVRELQAARQTHHWSTVIAYPFDTRTRVMPFRWLDRRVVPCGARSVAASLLECGYEQTRIVLGQWNPKFSPSATVKAGYRIDLLMISAMGLHAEEAYQLIRDAHELGEERPLILLGGPKAIYEPEDGFGISPEQVGAGIDVAVTGEEPVTLALLLLLAENAEAGETPLAVFERLRASGRLNEIPGLVYRAPQHPPEKPYLINTGVQRLLRDLDELPMPLAGYTCLELPHRTRRTLSAEPGSLAEVRKHTFISSLVTTHGCRFNCDFCPIPAYQQRTWRHKSPERLTAEIEQLGEALNFRYFFGTDDNFFNDRDSVEAIFSAMSTGKIHGVPFSKSIHFITEATAFDVAKNADLLRSAAEAGLKTIYFGIEDLSANLINKGQTAEKTVDLFRELHRWEIEAYAMMIHHDDQPLWSRDPQRLGVMNQAKMLYDWEAIGYHTTYITPSMGARNVEQMFGAGEVLAEVAGRKIPEAFYDGNHVIASRHRRLWWRQIQLWLAYLTFYNPYHFAKLLAKDLRNRHQRRRFKWQLVGGSMIIPSILKEIPFTLSLLFGKQRRHQQTPARCLPMIDAQTGERIRWGIDADVPYEVPLVGDDESESEPAQKVTAR